VKASTRRTSTLTVRLSMTAEAEKHMNGEMQYVVLLCECEICDHTTIVCFFEGMLYSMEWLTRGRQCH
jgi:hypothetical protein